MQHNSSSNSKTSILLNEKNNINKLISYYDKKLNYYKSKLKHIDNNIMKTCEHSEIINYYYYDYEGTQNYYVCKFCKLIGPDSWSNKVVESKPY